MRLSQENSLQDSLIADVSNIDIDPGHGSTLRVSTVGLLIFTAGVAEIARMWKSN